MQLHNVAICLKMCENKAARCGGDARQPLGSRHKDHCSFLQPLQVSEATVFSEQVVTDHNVCLITKTSASGVSSN